MSKTPAHIDPAADLFAGDIRKTQSWRSIRRLIATGVALSVLIIGGIGTLAATTVLSGAVATSGRLEVESKIKKVQHPTGGVVAAILVRDGDRVAAGDVLLRLDETIARANLSILRKGLNQFSARLARLTHEQEGKDVLVFPPELEALKDDPDVAMMLTGERKLFDARRITRDSQRSQLSERVQQSRKTIEGLIAQSAAKDDEINLIASELIGVRELYAKKLIPLARVSQLERDASRLNGERGAILASMASERGRIAEIELQILSIDQQLRQDVAKEIREVQTQVAEVTERAVAAADTLKRLDIRAPQSGVINQSVVNTVGGVISPGEALMQVVPDHDQLLAEIAISPADIDQVYPGQPATISLSAFDRTTTPQLNATLSYISADLSKDERSGATYYSAKITVSPEEVARLKGLKLLPGMPVEAFLRTSDRTIFSYLTKPLTDQMHRAFRES